MVPRFIELLDASPLTPTEKLENYKLREAGLPSARWAGLGERQFHPPLHSFRAGRSGDWPSIGKAMAAVQPLRLQVVLEDIEGDPTRTYLPRPCHHRADEYVTYAAAAGERRDPHRE